MSERNFSSVRVILNILARLALLAQSFFFYTKVRSINTIAQDLF